MHSRETFYIAEGQRTVWYNLFQTYRASLTALISMTGMLIVFAFVFVCALLSFIGCFCLLVFVCMCMRARVPDFLLFVRARECVCMVKHHPLEFQEEPRPSGGSARFGSRPLGCQVQCAF